MNIEKQKDTQIKDKEIEKMIENHQRVLFILGVAMSMIMSKCKGDSHYEWLMKAIENVVYKDMPLPELPKCT